MSLNKTHVAFIKYGGLSAGGTEKLLQTIAANLPKDKFDVTYFYCSAGKHIGADANHPSTDIHRKQYLDAHGVKQVEFTVGSKDLTTPYHTWRNTNFWEVFNENDFDIIQTGRAGHKEYPFNKITKTPIVDSIHLTAGVDNQFNIARVMHICQWSADRWTRAGGDKSRVVLISHPIVIEDSNITDLRKSLGIAEDVTVFGFHQRDSGSIFSPTPLDAYKLIENKKTHFIILGGSRLYREQAQTLGLKKITFLDHTANPKDIYSFLKTLNVYAHGRKDGEVNSTAMAEALYFGLSIVSHLSSVNNGHVECIGEAGLVVAENDVVAYANELQKLVNDKSYYNMRSQSARQRFAENYELTGQMKRIESIYQSVIEVPFPNPIRRRLYSLHWTQNIRIWLKWVYLKVKYLINDKV